MIAHHKTQVPNMRLINKVEVQGFVCEKKSCPMNWVVFAKWTIWDQLRKIQALESSQHEKTIHIEADPNSNNEDSEDGETKNKNGEEELKNKVEEHIVMEVMAQLQGLCCLVGPMWLLYLHQMIG